MNNHIEIYKNRVSSDLCKKTIDYLEKSKLRERTEELQKLGIKDSYINLHEHYKDKEALYLLDTYEKILLECFKEYFKKYHHTKYLINPFTKNPIINKFLVQKTVPGEGYLSWHHEKVDGLPIFLDRFLVFTLYLNDIEEGGETEFLHQEVKVKPKQGNVCLFPSSFTHIHRGNTPKKETKYIVTGWFHTNKN